MTRLEIEQLSVCYGAELALRDVELRIDAGEVVAVIGPSGCGKSTLLRAVAGLEPLSSGIIRMDGRDVSATPTHERDLGLMFQTHVLFPHLRVGENVGFGLEMSGMSRGERERRVSEMLDLVELGSFADRAVESLSGGEAQRVALARALAPSPGLLMLDEPLGSLDRVLREQLTADLRRLVRLLGLTTLHVTHDQAEAFALADRVVVLHEGRVVQVGRPDDLWWRPANSFVAEFVGHPNRWRLDDGSIEIVPISAVLSGGARRGGRMIEATVEFASFRDGRFTVEAVRDATRRVVYETNARPEIGERVELGVDESSVIVVES